MGINTRKSNFFRKRYVCSQSAFTLIELLVVISIIAVLMAILMPALRRAKDQARKVQCANNLKQLGLSMNMYGNDNNAKLPLNASGNWLWDIAYSTTDYIMATGGERSTFYCPSDTTKDPDMAVLWQFSQDGITFGNKVGDVAEPKTGRERLYRVTGYYWMLDTGGGRNTQPSGPGNKKWVRSLNCKQPATTELITDATISTTADLETADFQGVQGGLYNEWEMFDRTNHLGQGAQPQGGNIVFVDGHLEWRKFTDMRMRWERPYHWW